MDSSTQHSLLKVKQLLLQAGQKEIALLIHKELNRRGINNGRD